MENQLLFLVKINIDCIRKKCKKVISEIANKVTFIHILEHNPGLIVLKLGGEVSCRSLLSKSLVEVSCRSLLSKSLVEVSCRSLLLRLFLDAPHPKGGGGT